MFRTADTFPPAPPVIRRASQIAPVLLVVAIALFAALARVPRLHTPDRMVFDEVYYAKAAQQMLRRVEVTEERTHPPLSKLIIAAGILVAGDNAVGWRLPSALAGVGLVLVVYVLTALLFRDTFIAAASAMLVALDGLVFVESRIAKPDIFLTLFLFGAFAAAWRYVDGCMGGAGTSRAAGVRWVYVAGAAAGCAVATKWTTVVPLATIPLVLALLVAWGRITIPRPHAWHVVLAFSAVPAAVYLATYVPYFLLGHGIRDLMELHVGMYRFHASLTEGHPYQSAWWSWPLLLRPIWYEYDEVLPGLTRGILAIGNPIIWWASLPAFAFVVSRAVRTRSAPDVFLVAGVALSYFQYAFIPRALFLYHFLPSLIFLVIGLAAALAEVRARVGGGVVLIFALIAAGWFVAYYPVLSALPMAAERMMRLMWFGTWI
ncbi:MAG: phospholipid carrier-dependent glycosyltransferase [Armatimonadota bacterium]|nr:phospholipid carrier-dependent glycosyltransferase [Armatimonadota bacterium]